MTPESTEDNSAEEDLRWFRLYKPISLILSVSFGLVGLTFLFIPGDVLIFFNSLSHSIGFRESPDTGIGFYQVLAVGYMYLVTLLAYLMYRQPKNRYFLLLLINGKSASSVFSFAFFLLQEPYLVFLANGVVDGLIALGLVLFYRQLKRVQA
jgi:hypothetical protein